MATPRRLRARAILVASLSHAMKATGSNGRAVARLAEVKPITIHRWLESETPVNVEALICCPVLGAPFRDALCRFDHSDDGAPTFAKKRGTK